MRKWKKNAKIIKKKYLLINSMWFIYKGMREKRYEMVMNVSLFFLWSLSSEDLVHNHTAT